MYTVAAFYRFFALGDPQGLRDELHLAFVGTGLCGTTLLAPEGINGTMAGPEETIAAFLAWLEQRAGLKRSEVKFSTSEKAPFRRLKFKCKREIITFRAEEPVDPARPGTYVEAANWNALVADPDVLVLDTRNTYETEMGSFAGAVKPPLEKFSDFAGWVAENLDPAQHTKVAMFCTGGIRCEKASAYMLQLGFPEVYHLRGGILRYLEETRVDESRWNGECYIFDERVAVKHDDLRSEKLTGESGMSPSWRASEGDS
ncbi:MAG TPA: rhodanese-like domain-containing protein [Acidobacteriaceae bacterium]|nr:rhodanese-like domain-containing protein [Acidobacteriaceae bacterium]